MNVYFRLNGGLGNQMFEYAFLYSLLKECKEIEKIQCVMHHSPLEDVRFFSLDCYNISLPLEVIDESKCDYYFKVMMAKRKLLYGFFKKITKDEVKTFDRIKKAGIFYSADSNFYSDLELSDIKKRNIYIEGCYQAYEYVRKNSDDLRREFTVSTEPDERNSKVISELSSCESVCIHIRRGDYLNNHYAGNLAICDYDYYRKSMNEIRSCVKNPVFYVFSNTHEDIEWIKKNYDLGNVNYIDLGNKDYEELRLMSYCKHFIISNSTFSWWAQFLSTEHDKVVVAPKVWNRSSNATSSNIFMPDWHLIEV